MPTIMQGQMCRFSPMGKTIEARMLRSLDGTRKVAKMKWKLTMSKPK